MSTCTISSVAARWILDSRGWPTVEVQLAGQSQSQGQGSGELQVVYASVPSGASTGEFEAHELRDGDANSFLGRGVELAVANIRTKLAPELIGKSYSSISEIDQLLLKLDNTENKHNLGANAILAVSVAAARLLAKTRGIALYSLLRQEAVSNFGLSSLSNCNNLVIPTPLMNVVNGGAHAGNNLIIQEYMLVPHGFAQYSEALHAGVLCYHKLRELLQKQGLSVALGDEGGYACDIGGDEPDSLAMEFLLQAIEQAGYVPGEQISLALDCAASEFFDAEKQAYKVNVGGHLQWLDAQMWVERLASWVSKYPLVSLEDAMDQHDQAGWRYLTEKLGEKVQLVGDDLFVTNQKLLKQGIENKLANAILIKPNQIGSLSETLATISTAYEHNYACVISHRSGETNDDLISHLAVAVSASQIKTGAPARGERVAKYNELLRLQEQIAIV